MSGLFEISQEPTGLEPVARVAFLDQPQDALQQSQYRVVVPVPDDWAWMIVGRREEKRAEITRLAFIVDILDVNSVRYSYYNTIWKALHPLKVGLQCTWAIERTHTDFKGNTRISGELIYTKIGEYKTSNHPSNIPCKTPNMRRRFRKSTPPNLNGYIFPRLFFNYLGCICQICY